MKLRSKFLVFAMALLLSLSAFAIGASAETSAPITYEGLSARTTQDFAGLRAIYKVDESKFGEGAVIYGVLAASATKVDSIDALTVAMDGEGKLSNAADTQMVVVRDDTNKNDPTNTYTNAEKTEFAYTIAYFYESQTPDILKNDFFFRAFYIVGNDAPVYVGMSGENFGTASSLFDVATVLSTDAEFKDDFKDVQAIKNILKRGTISTLKTEVEFKTADAVSSVITLTDMTPGIYVASAKVTGTSKQKLGFTVAEVGESYNARVNDGSTVSSADAFVPAFPCILAEGTNTLTLYAGTATVTDYKLELTEAFPTAAENLTAHVGVGDMRGAAYKFMKLTCPKVNDTANAANCTNPNCTGIHYRKCSDSSYTSYVIKWDPNGTCYYSLDELPDNCFIRDCTAFLESAGTRTDTGSSNGFGYQSATYQLFLRAGHDVKMTVNVSKAGRYNILGVGSGISAAAKMPSFTVNGTEATPEYTAWTDPAEKFQHSSSESAGAYGSYGSVELKEGKNTVVLHITKENLSFTGFTFVLDTHTVDFTYEDGEGTHILSRQTVVAGGDADIPTFLPEELINAGYRFSADELAKATNITADTIITLTKSAS